MNVPTSRAGAGEHRGSEGDRETIPVDEAAASELRARALLVHERLCVEYKCPIAFFHDFDPLSELVSSLLSHRTRNSDSGRAFKATPRAVRRLGRGPRRGDARRGRGDRAVHLARAESPPAPGGAPRDHRAARGRPGARLPGRSARGRGAGLARDAPRRRPEDQRRRPPVQPPAPPRLARRQPSPPRRRPPRPDPSPGAGRPRPRPARSPVAPRLVGATGLRQPRSAHAPRPALLLLQEPGVRALPGPGPVPVRAVALRRALEVIGAGPLCSGDGLTDEMGSSTTSGAAWRCEAGSRPGRPRSSCGGLRGPRSGLPSPAHLCPATRRTIRPRSAHRGG